MSRSSEQAAVGGLDRPSVPVVRRAVNGSTNWPTCRPYGPGRPPDFGSVELVVLDVVDVVDVLDVVVLVEPVDPFNPVPPTGGMVRGGDVVVVVLPGEVVDVEPPFGPAAAAAVNCHVAEAQYCGVVVCTTYVVALAVSS